MKKILTILTGVLILGLTSAANAQAAEGYIVVERHSTRVLVASNTEEKIPQGAFSQLATVKVALDWAKASNTSLATTMIVPNGIVVANNPLQLQPGDQIALRDAIYSISMANDEASSMMVADFVGRKLLQHRQQGGDSVGTFVKEMNHFGKSLKLKNTKFLSPSGGKGTTTVSDLARLASGILKTHGYSFYTDQKSRKLNIVRVSGETEKLTVINNNKLLGKTSISGMMVDGVSAVLSADRKPFVEKLPNDSSKVTPVQLIVINVASQNLDVRAQQLVTEGWAQYDAWREAGYPASKEAKEYLR